MNWVWCVSLMQEVPILVWQLLLLFGLTVVTVGSFFARKKIRLIFMSAGCILVLFATFFLACYAHTQRCCWVRMMQPVSVRTGPAPWYHEIGTIGADDIVQIEQVHNAWHCLQTKKCKGWAYLA